MTPPVKQTASQNSMSRVDGRECAGFQLAGGKEVSKTHMSQRLLLPSLIPFQKVAVTLLEAKRHVAPLVVSQFERQPHKNCKLEEVKMQVTELNHASTQHQDQHATQHAIASLQRAPISRCCKGQGAIHTLTPWKHHCKANGCSPFQDDHQLSHICCLQHFFILHFDDQN